VGAGLARDNKEIAKRIAAILLETRGKERKKRDYIPL
jgi:hypothetical protein